MTATVFMGSELSHPPRATDGRRTMPPRAALGPHPTFSFSHHIFSGTRPAGDHRLRRSVLRGSGSRNGRGERLADAALQLRRALAETDPVLLVYRGGLLG